MPRIEHADGLTGAPQMRTQNVFTSESTMPEADPPLASSPRRVGVREFRSNLTGFLRQVRLGASLLITSHEEVVAELHPPKPPRSARRRPGALRGKIRMAPDFDTLPREVLAAMEDGED